MDAIYQQLLQRNARETLPFVSIHEAYSSLLYQIDSLQWKCKVAEREILSLRHDLQDTLQEGQVQKNNTSGLVSKSQSTNATAATLKNEAVLRDKLEQLQKEFDAKLKSESDSRTESLKFATQLSEMKDMQTAQDKAVSTLKQEKERYERTFGHLSQELVEARSRAELAEKQYDGLKLTIRSLQEENDKIHKESREFQRRLVADKGKTVDEINMLNETVDALRREIELLRNSKGQEKKQEEKRRSWFGAVLSPQSDSSGNRGRIPSDNQSNGTVDNEVARTQGDDFRIVLPSTPKHSIDAHSMEGHCIRYDAAGSDLVATASSDSTVKVWDTTTGSLRATLRSTQGQSILACDLCGNIVVGAGSDKTCRVWKLRTERMIHQLVGHQHKITCLRLFDTDRWIITGSADCSLKVWDMSGRTYHQVVSLLHGSNPNCVDVGTDSVISVSGHSDGGLRFWDLRSGEKIADIPDMHDGGITSVQFHPVDPTKVLTNGFDSRIKVIDLKMGKVLRTFWHSDIMTTQSWSRCVYSPDGKYITAASNTSGTMVIWDSGIEDKAKVVLSGHHKGGVCAIDWSRGGNREQQVASLDRKGGLILWA